MKKTILAVSSWISTGENQPVSGDQNQHALDGNLIQQIAEQVGSSKSELPGDFFSLTNFLQEFQSQKERRTFMKRLMKNISFLFCWSALVGFAVAMVLVVNVPPTLGQAAKKALVDLNSASEKELEALPGVGAATAKKITANRPYKSVDELSKAGLSAKKIETLKPLVTVGATPPAAKPAEAPAKAAPAAAAVTKAQPVAEKAAKSTVKLAPGQKVNINTASKEQLDALPGIGPVKAQAIIDGRPYQKPEDIMKVKGIKQGEFNKIKDLITVK